MMNSKDQVKKIFYVDKVEFLRSMMELSFRSKKTEIYTVDTLENNFYLLDDLSPDLILFDVESVRAQLEELCQYTSKNLSKTILVAVGNESDKAQVSSMVKKFFLKPLDASKIADQILSLIDWK